MSLTLLGVGGGGAAPPALTRSQEILADSPLGFYRQREASGTTLVDSSGNARDGTYAGGVTLGGTYDGQPGASYDGTGDATLSGITSVFNRDVGTLLLWARPTTLAVDAQVGLGFFASGTLTRSISVTAIGVSDGYTVAGNRTVTTNSRSAVDATTRPLGAWVAVALVWDTAAPRLELYINGASVALSSLSLTAWGATSVLLANAPVAEYVGQLADVAVYGTALSAARIAAIAAAPND